MENYSKEIIFYVENYHKNELNEKKHRIYIELEYELLNRQLLTLAHSCFDELFLYSMKVAEEELSQKYHKEIILRVINYPTTNMIKYLDKDNVGELVQTTALVKNITPLRLKLMTAIYSCKHCGHFHEVEENSETATLPRICKMCGSKIGFKLLPEESTYDDYKYLSLEEPLELRTGGDSREFKARVDGYLASPYYNIKPGDVCDVTGILKVEFNEKTKALDLIIDVWHIKPLNDAYEEIKLYDDDIQQIKELSQNEDIFQILVDSIAPEVYGYEYIKEGLVLQMFEGNRPRDGGINNKERHLIHILLIGDPGIGKSKLIESVVENSPKAIKSNGAGATKAGLLASAEKNEITGTWGFSCGALPLADGGMVTIDEFDKLSKDVMKALNEPMEQLTLSIAKAGIVQTMTARTSVLAGANPKYSKFVPTRSLEEQLDIPQSTISRFDLIYVMNDEVDYDTDLDKARKILKNDFENAIKTIDKDILKKYINFAKNNVFPVLSDEAIEYISVFYARTRRMSMMEEDIGKPITMRELTAIKRLATARAKVELRDVVTIDDAKEAIRIYSKSLEGLGLSLATVGELQNVHSNLEMNIIKMAEDEIRELYEEYGKMNKEQEDAIIILLRSSFNHDVANIKKLFKEAHRNIIDERRGGGL